MINIYKQLTLFFVVFSCFSLSNETLLASTRSNELSLEQLSDKNGTPDVDDEITTEVAISALKARGETGRNVAYAIAKSIMNRPARSGPTTFEIAVDNVFTDHSQGGRIRGGDSYYKTESKSEVRRIMQTTITDPDGYEFYEASARGCEMEIYKYFSLVEVQEIISGHKNLGFDGRKETDANTALVCFGLNNIRKESGKTYWNGGSMMTSYPIDRH